MEDGGINPVATTPTAEKFAKKNNKMTQAVRRIFRDYIGKVRR